VQEYKSLQNRIQNTPLYLVAQNVDVEAIETLYETKTEVNTRGDKQRTPLHFVAQSGYIKAFKILLLKGKTSALGKKNQRHLLHLAAQSGDSKTWGSSPFCCISWSCRGSYSI